MASRNNLGKTKLRINAGSWRGRSVPFSSLPGLRPTGDRVRETLFNWLQAHIQSASCLDLFAGSGILGWESLSRGAAKVMFVERHSTAIRALAAAQGGFEVSPRECTIVQADALQWLASQASAKTATQRFDIIFLDPPFNDGLLADVFTHLPMLCNHNAMIYFEAPRNAPLPELPLNCHIHRHKETGNIQYGLIQYSPSPELPTLP